MLNDGSGKNNSSLLIFRIILIILKLLDYSIQSVGYSDFINLWALTVVGNSLCRFCRIFQQTHKYSFNMAHKM